ncbi:MAG: YkgJ family cysteine cluster protein [Candidatus Methanoperedens sp.]|nr:YkgJ family cysteine cluster protein [Candidatus Methanoperedens sp.]
MKEKIKHLEKELEAASMIDESFLSHEIRAVGFKCTRCARCCTSDHGDNIVAVFPFEIRKICENTGKKAEDIVIPTPSLDKDKEGNIHTFEWVIRNDGDCIFLKNSLCKIYEWRPYICKTYPFYLQEGNLMISECDGIGEPISLEESQKLAAMLKERYITEIKESILLFQKFRGFRPGGKGICVHDSEGEHWIKIEPGTIIGN